MEPSQIFGAAEECHSSDSGWTMYIGSPIEDDDDNDNGYTEANPEDDSDDSMVSDASSGPSHRRNNPWRNCEGGHGHGLRDFQRQADQEEEFDDDDDDKYPSANKTKEKQIAEKKMEKKEVLFIDNNNGKAPAQSGGSVRINQNHRLAKRK